MPLKEDTQKEIILKVRLYPFSANRLEWLAEKLKKSRQEIINEAIVNYARFWADYWEISAREKDKRQKNLD